MLSAPIPVMAVKTVASAPCLLVEDSSSMLDPQRRQVVVVEAMHGTKKGSSEF